MGRRSDINFAPPRLHEDNPDHNNPDGPSHALCRLLRTCIGLVVLLLSFEFARVKLPPEIETAAEDVRRQRNPQSRQAVVAAGDPLVEEPPQAENACRLSFSARWLLFVLVMASVVILPAIQEPGALTSEIDVSPIMELVPKPAIVKEAVVAAREVAIMFRPEQCGVFRLLETLYEVCAQA
ncbi:hypothetical protein FS749_005375, partial [Ceratobasidium sp. UAMH 11750]